MTNKEEIYSFLKSNDFRLVDQDISEYFGDYYDIYATDDLELKFSSSKSFETIDIRRIEDIENWYDLALVKALLNNEIKLIEITTIEAHSQFLKGDLSRIMELFDKRNYPITKMKLDELGDERVKQIFSGKYTKLETL